MSALIGQKMPQSKSGVTAIRSAFYDAAGPAVSGDCEYAREESFVQWCRATNG
jgi:hypothetical protein